MLLVIAPTAMLALVMALLLFAVMLTMLLAGCFRRRLGVRDVRANRAPAATLPVVGATRAGSAVPVGKDAFSHVATRGVVRHARVNADVVRLLDRSHHAQRGGFVGMPTSVRRSGTSTSTIGDGRLQQDGRNTRG